MHKYHFQYEHKIGDTIYHKVSGNMGIVVDIIYYAHANITKYVCVFGRYDNDETHCLGVELTKEKVIL